MGVIALTEWGLDENQWACWERLRRRAGAAPLYGPAWVDAKVRHFGIEKQSSLLAAISEEDGEWTAALPLMREDRRYGPARLRVLKSPASEETSRSDLLALNGEQGHAGVEAIFRHLNERGDWDVLELGTAAADGGAQALAEVAASAGHMVRSWEAQLSPVVLLRGDSADPEQGLSGRSRKHLRQARRGLRQLGAVEVTAINAGGAEIAAFRAFEARGWKGREAGPPLEDDGFLASAVAAACHADEFVLHRLSVAGAPVAMSLSLRAHPRWYLWAIAYDEAHARFSPGHLLIEELVGQAGGEDFGEFRMMGREDPYKLRWTRRAHPHCQFYIYRKGLRMRAWAWLRHHPATWLRRLAGRDIRPTRPVTAASGSITGLAGWRGGDRPYPTVPRLSA